YTKICERTTAAVQWFLPKMETELLEATEKHIDEWKVRKRTKKYIQELKALLLDFKRKYEILKHCLTIAEALTKDQVLQDIPLYVGTVKDESVQMDDKEEEGEKDTKRITLDMYQDGMDIAEIAKRRGLVEGTVYGHLIHFVGTDIDAEERSEEHTSELQSREKLVCRLLLEK